MRRLRILVALAMVLVALPAGAAFAQYPQPAGACSITPPAAELQPGQTAVFTVSVQTGSGQPAPGVAGTVSATGGTVQTATFTTGADGKASITVVVGANPGNLTLQVTCGALQTSSVVRVVSPAVSPFIPKPPDTGTGGQGGDSFPLTIVLGLVALAGVGATGTLVASRRRR